MPEMAEVIDRDPTAINADLSWLQGEKGFRAAGDGVGKPQGRHQAQKGGSNHGSCLTAQFKNLGWMVDPSW